MVQRSCKIGWTVRRTYVESLKSPTRNQDSSSIHQNITSETLVLEFFLYTFTFLEVKLKFEHGIETFYPPKKSQVGKLFGGIPVYIP